MNKSPRSNALHFEVSGHGQTVVLVHGWGFHAGVWDALAESLSQDFKLLRPDLPGHGQSPLLDDGYGIDAVVDAICERVDGSAIWVGWSLGALIAMRAAIRHPSRVQGLVPIAGTPCFTSRRGWHHGIKRELLDRFGEELTDNWQLTLRRFLALQGRGCDSTLLRRVRAMMMARMPTPEGLRGALELLRDTDLRYQVHEIECPVLAVNGVEDHLVPLAGGKEWTRQVDDARMLVFKDAGHMPFLSHPRGVELAIRGFADYGPVFRNDLGLDFSLSLS